MKFSEMVTQYVVKTEADKIKENTHDDYGVYPMVFIGGDWDFDHKPPIFHAAWGLLSPEVVSRVSGLMSGHAIGSLEFTRTPQGGFHARARSRDSISQFDLGPVEDFPAALEFILK